MCGKYADFDSQISTNHAFSRDIAPSMAQETTFDKRLTQNHADSRAPGPVDPGALYGSVIIYICIYAVPFETLGSRTSQLREESN